MLEAAGDAADDALQELARAVVYLRGKPVKFILDACRNAYEQHEADLDAAASAACGIMWHQVSAGRTSTGASNTSEAAASLPLHSTPGLMAGSEQSVEECVLSWTDSDEEHDSCSPMSGNLGPGCRAVYDASTSSASLARHLTHPDFCVVKSCPLGVGSVLWDKSTRHQASAKHWTHAFPGEEWLTEKDWLAHFVQLTVGRRSWAPESFAICEPAAESGSMRCQVRSHTYSTYTHSPQCAPLTFKCRLQLLEFVGSYLNYARSLDAPNVWIIKPARLSRSRGVTIADDLHTLLAACMLAIEQRTPVVASRYILHPVLYCGRKFDLRFIVVVRSVRPLVLAVYNRWIVRCADEQYSASEFTNLRAHLTVMQYLDDVQKDASTSGTREWVTRQQLVKHLESAYGPAGSEQRIISACHAVLVDCFQLATAGMRGAANEVVGINPAGTHIRTCACYGLDLLLLSNASITSSHGSRELQPVLLEVNYKPDLRRVLQENEHFYNELFPVLFSDRASSTVDSDMSSWDSIPGWTNHVATTELP